MHTLNPTARGVQLHTDSFNVDCIGTVCRDNPPGRDHLPRLRLPISNRRMFGIDSQRR
ncbi:hypothetical protein D3C73_1541050 [compost metagenome]